jgi:uncharacterized protein (DUF1501 family)
MPVEPNRRRLLQGACALPLSMASVRLWAAAPETPRFVLVFLRGAYDPLSLLVPQGSAFYAEARPRIAVPLPGSGEGAATALDADWALAPAAAEALAPLWQAGQLAFVPFAGNDDLTRSHFETQDSFELGQGLGPGRDYRSGFLNRLAAQLGLDARAGVGREPLAFTDQLPLVFQGRQAVGNAALREVGKVAINDRQTAAIARMYAGTPLAATVQDGFRTRSEVMQDVGDEMLKTGGRNAVNARGFEGEARRIGRLMRERVALGFVDIGGWDTHANQGAATGALASRLGELSRGLVGLADEMGPEAWSRTVVCVASEFGRTFRENGNRGTDHGHGTTYWFLGGGLRGGRILGRQQPLRADTLFQNRDLPVLNEYRALLAGVWARQYGLDRKRLDAVFAGVTPLELGLV